jgi:hypothetical protein
MGFSNHTLCKSERESKEMADKLDAAEAGERVWVVSEMMASYLFRWSIFI